MNLPPTGTANPAGEPRIVGNGDSVGPHNFAPLRRWWNRGRCRACFVHERKHPVGWTRARPLGDKSAASGFDIKGRR